MWEAMKQRRICILRWLLTQTEPVALTDIAKRLGRPREEVRRDVDQLCQDGFATRRFARETRACFDATHKVKVVVVRPLPAGAEWLRALDAGEEPLVPSRVEVTS